VDISAFFPVTEYQESSINQDIVLEYLAITQEPELLLTGDVEQESLTRFRILPFMIIFGIITSAVLFYFFYRKKMIRFI